MSASPPPRTRRASRRNKQANASRRNWATVTSLSSRKSLPQSAAGPEERTGGDKEVSSGVAAAAGRDAVAGVPPAGDSGVEGERDQDGSSASRQSVDELFARIRASRAAEEAVAVAAEEAVAVAAASVPVGAELEQVVGITEDVLVVTEQVELAGEVSLEVGEDDQGAQVVVGDGEETAESLDVAVDAEITEVVGPASDADAITEPDVESLARRDHLLGSITAKLGRALKRALQDDQNDLLNAFAKVRASQCWTSWFPAMSSARGSSLRPVITWPGPMRQAQPSS